MPTIAETLADYAADLTYDRLPGEVVHQAKRLHVDTLGCALGGYASEPARIARDLAGLVTGTPPATVIGSGQKTSLDLAVFANGVMIRYLDYNDGYNGRESGHPSDSIAALLSCAEIAGSNGRELIAAIVLAYEVFCGLCDAARLRSRGFDHVTYGGIASAVGASRLLGLNRQQTVHAINLTAAANVALFQTRIGEVSLWKGCAFANASRNAVFAAQLAQRGMTGPAPVFEGAGGFFKAVTGEPFALGPLGGDGQPFKIMQCSIKRYPLGLYSQSVVEAALQARPLVEDVGDIASVEIRTLQTALDIMAGDPEKWRPRNRETADHSMPYTAAVGLMYGKVDQSHFDDQYLADPALLDLVGRVKCIASEEANRRAPEAMLCDIDLVMRSGQRRSARVEYYRGHWRNPMADSEIEAKFHSLAGEMLPSARADALLAELWRLEALPRTAALLEMTRKEAP
jgi:2-methylcitrate dehydratase